MDQLIVKGFKCFTASEIPINKLTVLAGANGAGKSTTIQAMLFMRQTIELSHEFLDGHYVISEIKVREIPLNSNYMLALGSSSSIINRQTSSNAIELSILSPDGTTFKFVYDADEFEPKLHLDLKESPSYTAAIHPILKKEFYYLNAERIGPRASNPIRFIEYPNVGFQGEYTAQIISNKGGYTSILKERMFEGSSNPNLENQVNEWLNFIMPGTRISAKQSDQTMTAQIRVENELTKGDPTLATNIGFGISYVLPIIVNALVAVPNSYLIVENPEAHLHPSAQSRIGYFLAMIASCNVHVIVETHSDHVLNGIQIATAKNVVQYQDVVVNFFDEPTASQPTVEIITLDDKAELSKWPRGFFDQTQSDYASLIRLRR